VAEAKARRKQAQTDTKRHDWSYVVGLGCIALSLGGLIGPLSPMIRMEGAYALLQAQKGVNSIISSLKSMALVPAQAQSVPSQPQTSGYAPLVTESGSSIDPADTNFGIVIPKIGVNAKIVASVNPTNMAEYSEVLKTGIAHASTSFLPGENGTVYLFSHSTNFDWFVQDLNAVFYLLKNVEIGDRVVLFYEGTQYEYKITDKRVVSASAVSYLVPQKGAQKLILQTCWPPGSTAERLLIFADDVETASN
jgi:LPXTG-site transpeptidase (sortase) family protein